MDIHALTTSGEGWGIPTIEAMACEVPSVITDYTTTKEIVTDNNAGIAVPLAAELTGQYNVERAIVDVNKFSDAMSFMYEHPKERIGMGKNGRKAVIRDYSWDVVFPKWVTLLESLGR
jgi:glycosyltransferase involved in cell wall biosynthesis